MSKTQRIIAVVACVLSLGIIVTMSCLTWARIQSIDASFDAAADRNEISSLTEEQLAESIPGANPPAVTTEPSPSPSTQVTTTEQTSEESTTEEATETEKPQPEKVEETTDAPETTDTAEQPEPEREEPAVDQPQPEKTWRDPNNDLVELTSELTATDLGQWYQEVIVVDIDQQYVTYYRDGEVITEGPCVTGNTSTSPTPTGWYKVTSKRKTFNMNGNPKTYVDRFTVFNGGIGLHDAKWRSEFGGTIYKGNGSHGCVNLPDDVAFAIYDNAAIGTRVAVLP